MLLFKSLKVHADCKWATRWNYGHMLEVTLGPGLLSKNYDGLQNDLNKLTGIFLNRGEYNFPLDKKTLWHFVPLASPGDVVEASSWLGQVEENHQPHKIMVPFAFEGTYTVKSVAKEGEYTIMDTIAVVTDADGKDIKLNMIQKWPVKKAINIHSEKPRPFKLLETGVRIIDTVNPIVEGGTGFIPVLSVREKRYCNTPFPDKLRLIL